MPNLPMTNPSIDKKKKLKPVKIALAMIVRGDSEAKQFLRCLNSFMPHVDGLFVAVTGLEDHQQIHKIVKEYKGTSISTNVVTHPEIYSAKVAKDGTVPKEPYFFSNFAAARNVSFNLVPEKEFDYITWADVDDVLVAGEELKICAAISKQKGFDEIYFTYWYESLRDKNNKVLQVEIEQVRERLLKPGKYKWVSRLHEVAIPADPAFKPHRSEWNLLEGRKCVWLHLADNKLWDQKLKRNKEILAVQLEEEQWKDPRTIFSLAKIYFDMSDKDSLRRSFDLLTKYIDMSGWDAERANAMEYLGLIHEKSKDYKRAIMTYHRGIAEYPMDVMLWLRLANAYYELGHEIFADFWLDIAGKLDFPKAQTLIQNPKDIKLLMATLKLKQAINKGNDADMVLWADKRAAIMGRDDGTLSDLKAHHIMNEAARGFVRYARWLKDSGLEKTIPAVLDTVPKEWNSLPFINTIRNDLGIIKEWPKDSIVYYAHMNPNGAHFEQWDHRSLKKGIGGSETAVIHLTERWAKSGRKVTVYADVEQESTSENGVNWKPYYSFNWNDHFDTLILWRNPRLIDRVKKAEHLYMDLHDVCSALDYPAATMKRLSGVFFKSQYHRDMIPALPNKKAFIISNGIVI